MGDGTNRRRGSIRRSCGETIPPHSNDVGLVSSLSFIVAAFVLYFAPCIWDGSGSGTIILLWG